MSRRVHPVTHIGTVRPLIRSDADWMVRSMTSALPNLILDFSEIDLEFIGAPYRDVFGQKNNKTVAETLQHVRYQQLAKEVKGRYRDVLDKPLGTALFRLKQSGDVFYRRFLNPYGDLRYSTFRISSPTFECLTGVYAFFEGEALRYIGRCRDSMKKCITQGYGKIHPKCPSGDFMSRMNRLSGAPS